MPIYEYTCQKCGKKLELLHGIHESRSHCEDDCVADDFAGDGELVLHVSSPALATKSRDMALGKVDYDKAAKKGFTTYKRAGKGEYERIAGNAGPATLVNKD